nr:aminoglycoside 6-adenylyltransferase [Paenibacillus polymyxa]
MKYLEKHLEPDLWTTYIQTFADADYEHLWQSRRSTCDKLSLSCKSSPCRCNGYLLMKKTSPALDLHVLGWFFIH